MNRKLFKLLYLVLWSINIVSSVEAGQAGLTQEGALPVSSQTTNAAQQAVQKTMQTAPLNQSAQSTQSAQVQINEQKAVKPVQVQPTASPATQQPGTPVQTVTPEKAVQQQPSSTTQATQGIVPAGQPAAQVQPISPKTVQPQANAAVPSAPPTQHTEKASAALKDSEVKPAQKAEKQEQITTKAATKQTVAQAQTLQEIKPVEHVPQAPAEVPEEKSNEPQQSAKAAIKVGEGIDTLEQDGGNWLLKRQALEKTIDVIEKIKDVFTKILETRVTYLVKRNKTDRSFDTFANAIGFELGDLNQLLNTLLNQLKAERAKEGDLPEEEREVMQEIENKITELKGLKSTLKSITDMDASLDEVLMQLEKEITTSNSYQTRAWKNFQTIKKVLSDEKAEELYLQTESLLKNMQEILKYLTGDLMAYFDSLISTLKENMTSVQNKLKDLETKGVNLNDEVKKIKKAEKLARKNRKQKKEAAQKQTPEKTPEVKKQAKAGWFDYVSSVWRYPLSFVNSTYDYVMSFFVTKKPQVRPIASPAVEKKKEEAAKKESQEIINKEKVVKK